MAFFKSVVIAMMLAAGVGPVVAQKYSPTEIPPVALKTKGFDTKLLEPVDGVTLREYAHIVFEMFAGKSSDADAVVASHNISKERFDKITVEFTERFRKDPTFKYAEIYGAYYQEAAGGKYELFAKDYAQSVLNAGPLKQAEPMSWGSYMTLARFYAEKSMATKPTTRESSDAILAEKGMSFIDYQVLGAWFGRRLAVQSGR